MSLSNELIMILAFVVCTLIMFHGHVIYKPKWTYFTRYTLIDNDMLSYSLSTTNTGLLPGLLFSSGEMAGGRSKILSALNRLALEIPLDLYCVVFTNIIEHTWEWVQLPIINTLCQYRLTFQSVIFKIYSIARNSPTLKLKLSFGTNFLSNFLKGTTR